jgi:glycosyltransferase involved in cell wall biosynthesis
VSRLKRLRVLHCPSVVGGNPTGLAAAERELGLDSTTIVFKRSPYAYSVDEVIWGDDDRARTKEMKRWRFFGRALRDFDVIHFNFGSTIAPQRTARDQPGTGTRLRDHVFLAYSAAFEQLDLPLLARSGKAIFVTFQGDDARQGDISAALGSSAPVEAAPGHYTPGSDVDKRRRIARFDRYAAGIYALNPDLLHFLPARARFVPYAHVDARAWEPPERSGSLRPLVLHAPTNREIKGTRFVLDAVSRLQAEGVDFEFQLVEGLPHAEAKALYRHADLVVDQLLIGWYGGLAVELMALARPVVAYLREDDLGVLPPEMRAEIPIVSARPQTIYSVLKELLTSRRGELAELGRRGRAYVERWHDPLGIAKRIVADYEIALGRRRGGCR